MFCHGLLWARGKVLTSVQVHKIGAWLPATDEGDYTKHLFYQCIPPTMNRLLFLSRVNLLNGVPLSLIWGRTDTPSTLSPMNHKQRSDAWWRGSDVLVWSQALCLGRFCLTYSGHLNWAPSDTSPVCLSRGTSCAETLNLHTPDSPSQTVGMSCWGISIWAHDRLWLQTDAYLHCLFTLTGETQSNTQHLHLPRAPAQRNLMHYQHCEKSRREKEPGIFPKSGR